MVSGDQKKIICFLLFLAGIFSFFFSYAEFGNISPKEYNLQVNKANKYFKNRLYQEAKGILWKVISQYPAKPDAYINLASVYIEEENFETAIRLLKKGEKVSDDSYLQREILFYNLGLSYYFSRDYQQAQEYLSKAVGIHPDFGEAFFYLGKTNQKLGNSQKAYLDYFRANYIFSQQDRNHYLQKIPEFLNKLESGRAFDKKAISQSLNEIADRAREEGKLNKSLYFFEKSAALYSRDPTTYRKLAKLYASQNAFHNVTVYLNKLKEIEPSGQTYLELGRAYRALGKYQPAIEQFEKALKLDKENFQIPYEISLTYLKSNQYHTANKFINEAKKAALKKRDDKILEKINYLESEIDRALFSAKAAKPKQNAIREIPDYPEDSEGNLGNLGQGCFVPSLE